MSNRTHLAKPGGEWTVCGHAVNFSYKTISDKVPRPAKLALVEVDPSCKRCQGLSKAGRGLDRVPRAPGVVGAQAHIVQTRPGHFYFLPITVGTAFAEALYGETANPLHATAFDEVWWLNDVLLPRLKPHCPEVCIVKVKAELTLTPV